jgi:hypothetical protein
LAAACFPFSSANLITFNLKDEDNEIEEEEINSALKESVDPS